MTYSYWEKDVGSRENVIGGTLNSMPHVKSSVLWLKQSEDESFVDEITLEVIFKFNIQIVIQIH